MNRLKTCLLAGALSALVYAPAQADTLYQSVTGFDAATLGQDQGGFCSPCGANFQHFALFSLANGGTAQDIDLAISGDLFDPQSDVDQNVAVQIWSAQNTEFGTAPDQLLYSQSYDLWNTAHAAFSGPFETDDLVSFGGLNWALGAGDYFVSFVGDQNQAFFAPEIFSGAAPQYGYGSNTPLYNQTSFPLGEGFATGNSSGIAFRIQGEAAAVPEPASWALMLLGFGIAGAAMRRRKLAFA